MKHISRYNKQSIFVKYFQFLLIMLIIPTILGIVLFSLSMNGMMEQTKNNSLENLKQVQKGMDKDIGSVKSIAVNLGADSDLINFEYNKNDPNSVLQLSKLTKKIGTSYSTQPDLVFDTFVYIKKYDLIIGSNTIFSAKEVYDLDFKYVGMSYENWNDFLNRNYYNITIPKTTVQFENSESSKNIVTYAQSYPVGSSNNLGTVFVMMNADNIGSTYAESYNSDNNSVMFFNQQNEIVLNMGTDDFLGADFLHYSEGANRTKINGEDVLVFRENSPFGTKYISVEKLEYLKKALVPMKTVLIWYVIIVLLLGTCVLLVVLYAGVRPLRKSISSIEKYINPNNVNSKTDNEMEVIARGVREIVEKERSAQSIIERQLPILQYNLISKMIHGNIADAEKFKKSCEIVGIQLKYKKYCAILVVVSKEDKDSQIEEVSLVKYAIANIISELFNTSEMSSYIDDFGMEELVVVLNFDNLNNAEGKILENCECIKKVIEEQLDVKLQISIGRIYEGMERVPVSYREAEKSMEYKILTNNDDIIFFDESNENDCNYRYSLEQENAIMNAVVLGNVDVAKKLLDQIIEMNANVSVEMSRCLFFDLMSTMFRVLNQQELDLKVIFGNEYPYKLLVNCTTIDELRQTIFEILESICLYIKDNRSGKKEILKVAMIEYIEKNCENSNLSMETVADAFSVSYTYVSHFFKDYIGENFSNYLMNIRIEKAKKYLKETSLPISEIAQKLGYSNSAGLIRNFKKIAGVTPGKYRECDRE